MELSYDQYAQLMDELVAEGYDVLEASEMIFGYLEEQGTRTGSNPNVFRPTPSAPGSRRGAAPVSSSSSTGSVNTQRGTRTGSNLNVYTPPTSQGTRRGAASVRPTSTSTSPLAGATRPVTAPASAPATRAVAAPATRPAAAPTIARGSGPAPTAKVTPTSTATPAKPAGSAMQQWAAANPKLAAAAAERERTRGTSATTNPLMKDFKSGLPAAKPSASTPTTSFAKSTPALGTSSSAVQSAGTAAAKKAVTTGVSGFKMSTDLSKTNKQKINAGMEIRGNELQEDLRGDNYGGNARPDALLDAYQSIYNS